MYRILILLGMPLLLIGCAAGSVKDLQAKPSRKVELTLNQNYQQVYKNLLGKMQQCMGEGWAGVFAANRIDHQLLPDLSEASLSYVMSNAGYQNYYFHADIHGKGEKETELKAYVSLSTWNNLLDNMERWSTKPESDCATKKIEAEQAK